MTTFRIKPWHHVFINAYAVEGLSGTQSYMKARPGCNANTAAKQSGVLLAKPMIQDAVNTQTKQLETTTNQSALTSRAGIVQQAQEIKALALETGKLDTGLKSLDLQARVLGLFVADTPDMNTYVQLIQSLTVNIAGNTPTIPETTEPIDIIDVIPEK